MKESLPIKIQSRGGPLCKRGHVKIPGKICAECNRFRSARYYAKYRDTICEDRDIRAKNRAWKAANPERVRVANEAYKLANGERIKAEQREWYQSNKAIHALRVTQWRMANYETYRNIHNAAKNRRRARIKGAFGSHTFAEWQFILTKQRNKCEICGFVGKLEKDHRIPLAFGGSDMAVNLQGLCKPCNSSKSANIAVGTQFGIFDNISKMNKVVVSCERCENVCDDS